MTDEDYATAQGIKQQMMALEEERALWSADTATFKLTLSIGGRQLRYTPSSVITNLRRDAVNGLTAAIAALQAEFDAL